MSITTFPKLILLIISIWGINSVYAQTAPTLIELKSAILRPGGVPSKYDTSTSKTSFNKALKVDHVSKDFIYNHYYGRICKWETKRDNKKRQKVRLRLGDPSYVDKLEGK